MNILGIECSAVSAGAALTCEGVLLCEAHLNIGLTHSQTLMPLIDSVLTFAKTDISEVDVIAVSSGPGSFTGLRIGIGTAKGLALGADKQCCGVSSLEALCYNVPNAPEIIAPIMDARRGEVYNALYRWENGRLCELAPMRALPLAELARELPDGATFVGDGANVHRESLTELLGGAALFPTANLMYQRASSVAAAAENKEYVSPEQLSPVYIRKPQAERELEERNRSL